MVKKLISFMLLMSLIIVVGGCGQEKTASGKTIDKPITENTPKTLKITNKIDQLGNEAFPEGNSDGNSKLHVFEKDGYTYFVQPFVDVYNSEGMTPGSLVFNVSILKNNKWIVKDKQTELGKEILGLDITLSEGESLSQVLTTDMPVGSNYYISTHIIFAFASRPPMNELHKITFTPDGVAHYEQLVKNGDGDFSLLQGDQAYFVQPAPSLSLYKVFNQEGKEINSQEYQHVISDVLKGGYNTTFLTNNVLYFGNDNIDQMSAYNVINKDFVWNKDGSKKTLNIAEGNLKALTTVKKGIYTLTDSNPGIELNYTSLAKNSSTLVSTIKIPSALSIDNEFITLENNNICVYTLVTYKGKPTIQKYVIQRIDK